MANLSTRRKKPRRNRSVLGSSARKNAGVPIVSAVTTVRCRLRNGNGSVSRIVASETTIA